MPPRLGIRTSSRVSFTTAAWSSRAACNGPAASMTFLRLVVYPCAPFPQHVQRGDILNGLHPA